MSRRWDDSGGDYLETITSPYNISLNGAYSMAIFGNMDDTVDEITMLSKYNGIGPVMRIINKKVRFFTIQDAGGIGREAIGVTDTTPGTWQLYGGAWDGSNVMRVTLNGVQDGTDSMASQRAGTEAANWRIGLRNDNVFPFNGLIYYVAIWSSYLSDAHWLLLAAGECPDAISPVPVGFWILQGANPEIELMGGSSNLSLAGSAPQSSEAPPVMLCAAEQAVGFALPRKGSRNTSW